MKAAENWLDALLLFPRPEYAKQTEALLTDLIWRSPGSSLATSVSGSALFDELSRLKTKDDPKDWPEPDRLVPQQQKGGNKRTQGTLDLAMSLPSTGRVMIPQGAKAPVEPILHSLFAPQARGAKSIACVPLHPSVVALQTLHGLVNKESPSNLSAAIETMGWHGGAPSEGSVAASYLSASQLAANARQGVTGAIEWLLPEIAQHVWASLPALYQKSFTDWPTWPTVAANVPAAGQLSLLAPYSNTPFAWFWNKWQSLCAPSGRWHHVLPVRRFVDWALCLLRTGLAFSYLWEAEFYCRLHERIAIRAGNTPASQINRLESLLVNGASLATIEPPGVPASQKNMWPATSELIARGWKARSLFWEGIESNDVMPAGTNLVASLESWVTGLNSDQLAAMGIQLQTTPRMANNQKEFVKYLLLPRLSDDDSGDQADFYFLARTSTNSRQAWFRPGPEWLVVVTSLLCRNPGGRCTLGELTADLAQLGIRAERSVIVGLLEEAGLSTDSPDADNALVIRAGF